MQALLLAPRSNVGDGTRAVHVLASAAAAAAISFFERREGLLALAWEAAACGTGAAGSLVLRGDISPGRRSLPVPTTIHSSHRAFHFM